MKHISRYMLMVLMLCIVVSTVLCGCKKQTQTTAPQTGGVTDRTDKNAPKEIASKDIEEFFQKSVFLQLFVKVDKDWRSNVGRLKHYGYDLT